MQNWELGPEDAKQYSFDQLKSNKELAMKVLLFKVGLAADGRKRHNCRGKGSSSPITPTDCWKPRGL